MARAFSKDGADGHQPFHAREAQFTLYSVHRGAPRAVRQGDDLPALLRWAVTQPTGVYELRDRFGVPLARIGEAGPVPRGQA